MYTPNTDWAASASWAYHIQPTLTELTSPRTCNAHHTLTQPTHMHIAGNTVRTIPAAGGRNPVQQSCTQALDTTYYTSMHPDSERKHTALAQNVSSEEPSSGQHTCSSTEHIYDRAALSRTAAAAACRTTAPNPSDCADNGMLGAETLLHSMTAPDFAFQ